MHTPTEAQVLTAADAIVAAFSATDTDAYFAGFSPDASFIFHPEPARLNSRAEYEELWASWLASGWRVVSCASSDRLVQPFPGGAVFSHTVATSIDSADGPDSYVERESIIFRLEGDDRLIAVHEHLSTIPDTDGGAS
ncbi:nuclear transport factor 2 family protein [Leucobacter rhizosphaerae]|uniref:Nuclear transport factor 2 family protein n=1 Tax=Leucobacter rhizosphaerae TaxID=2932245 RepID=A0ABY4FZ52_9MICO|nr:nuclear transport factor 2 family protein [Leucobacter rhizosphaerae]UOQ61566.1 nuclear transport factor 2 family protein [Leucobacter rhizosphaerae]